MMTGQKIPEEQSIERRVKDKSQRKLRVIRKIRNFTLNV